MEHRHSQLEDLLEMAMFNSYSDITRGYIFHVWSMQHMGSQMIQAKNPMTVRHQSAPADGSYGHPTDLVPHWWSIHSTYMS